MNKIPRETAEAAAKAWLDHKCVSEKRREEKKDAIEALISAFEDGSFVMDDKTFKISQDLVIPIKSEVETTQLIFEPRISVDKVQKAMGGVKSDDLHGMIRAYVSALTGRPKAVIGALDTEDYNVAQKIAIFFM